MIILIILIVFGIYVNTQSSNINLGNSKITVPEGFKIIKSNDTSIVFDDGKNNITLFLFKNSPLNKTVKKYTDLKISQNQTVKEDYLNLSNEKVTRTTLKVGNTTYINYWFEKNSNTYQYHVEFRNNKSYDIDKIDNTISKLIKNIN